MLKRCASCRVLWCPAFSPPAPPLRIPVYSSLLRYPLVIQLQRLVGSPHSVCVRASAQYAGCRDSQQSSQACQRAPAIATTTQSASGAYRSSGSREDKTSSLVRSKVKPLTTPMRLKMLLVAVAAFVAGLHRAAAGLSDLNNNSDVLDPLQPLGLQPARSAGHNATALCTRLILPLHLSPIPRAVHRSSNRTIQAHVPGLSDSPIVCYVYGDACLFEGDVILGSLDAGGNLAVTGLLTQQTPLDANTASRRRLNVVEGFSAFFWPNSVVS